MAPPAPRRDTDGPAAAPTIAIGNSIWLGVAASVVALGAAFFLREIPLRRTNAPGPASPNPARAGASQAAAGID